MVIVLLVLPFLDPKCSISFHKSHALFYLAKDHMLAIHPLNLHSADEKLGTLCGIQHLPWTRFEDHMLQDEILTIRFFPIEGRATSANKACEVTILAQKSQNNSVIPSPNSFFQVLRA
ncbi:Hypothetical predicted protein [Lynx pardinus]|uniref:Uncharacterized protein n=1 Tax=Lynx pardinus TaxID=191816 RepID=A0A485MHG9_LYNPA|nr:Hypothetical predicted protein [Lynx pardinus]